MVWKITFYITDERVTGVWKRPKLLPSENFVTNVRLRYAQIWLKR